MSLAVRLKWPGGASMATATENSMRTSMRKTMRTELRMKPRTKLGTIAPGLLLLCSLAACAGYAAGQTGQPSTSTGNQDPLVYGPQPGRGTPPSAQNPPTHATPAPPAAAKVEPLSYSGCVTQSATDKDTLVLSTDTVCAKLTGTLAAAKLAGHQIDLKGVLTPRTAKDPASIEVDVVGKIGKVCTDTCALMPPRHRGLGGEKPGKEGGTPGAVPTPSSGPNQ